MDGETLEIGKIVNTHGLRGEVKVAPWCDDPSVFSRLEQVLIGGKAYRIVRAKPHKSSVLLTLSGVEDIDRAAALAGSVLHVRRDWLGALPEKTYYIRDLVGLSVYENDVLFGTLTQVYQHGGGSDVYEVTMPDGKKALLPAIAQVVKRVDIGAGRMDVALLEGLLDED